ncbi:unnamed protein product, partial [Mycena citricolor]
MIGRLGTLPTVCRRRRICLVHQLDGLGSADALPEQFHCLAAAFHGVHLLVHTAPTPNKSLLDCDLLRRHRCPASLSEMFPELSAYLQDNLDKLMVCAPQFTLTSVSLAFFCASESLLHPSLPPASCIFLLLNQTIIGIVSSIP